MARPLSNDLRERVVARVAAGETVRAFDDDAVCSDDQPPTQGPLAHLRRGPEALLAPGGMLAGRQAQPR